MTARKKQPTAANGDTGQEATGRRTKARRSKGNGHPSSGTSVNGSKATAADDPWEFAPGNSVQTSGRLASEVKSTPIQWFATGLIPRGTLSFVVGAPQTGKSTFGAWLCSLAKRPAILPGYEESVESSLVPRLAEAGANLARTLLLDGRHWSLPDDRSSLTVTLQQHRCDFLWIDPVDSYLGETDENDGQGVRSALESLSRIARDTGAAVVCARHPGKSKDNICPGSRQWRAVPRVIVELTSTDDQPQRYYLRLRRDVSGRDMKPREYHLRGEPGTPRRFDLGDQLPEGETEVLSISDSVDRWKVTQAIDLLTALLTGAEQESSYVYSVAEKERLGDRLVRTAAKRLGVKIRRDGVGKDHKSYWSLATPATPAVSQTPPPNPESEGPGGGVGMTQPE